MTNFTGNRIPAVVVNGGDDFIRPIPIRYISPLIEITMWPYHADPNMVASMTTITTESRTPQSDSNMCMLPRISLSTTHPVKYTVSYKQRSPRWIRIFLPALGHTNGEDISLHHGHIIRTGIRQSSIFTQQDTINKLL